MSNKSPYEIRLEILQMAEGIANTEFFQLVEVANTKIDNCESAFTASAVDALMPTMYTPKDIIKKATELRAFVEDKNI